MRLAIGDIHGRTTWKKYLDPDQTESFSDFSELYILGDYFDSFDIPFAKQRRNFLEICAAARGDKRIKLCLGNHDYHYLGKIIEQRYSGFQDKYEYEILKVLEDNIDLLKVVYVTTDNYILSHAGVSSTFLKKIQLKNNPEGIERINKAFEKDRNILTFDGDDIYGDDVTQSPIWIRPKSLSADPVAGWNQIVGHTQQGEISEFVINGTKPNPQKIIFIDTGDVDSVYLF